MMKELKKVWRGLIPSALVMVHPADDDTLIVMWRHNYWGIAIDTKLNKFCVIEGVPDDFLTQNSDMFRYNMPAALDKFFNLKRKRL